MLLLGDSFSPEIAKFLSLHFAEVQIYFDRMPGHADLIKMRPDVVLLEVVERSLSNLLDRLQVFDLLCQ